MRHAKRFKCGLLCPSHPRSVTHCLSPVSISSSGACYSCLKKTETNYATEYNGCAVGVKSMKKELGEMVKLNKLKMEGNKKKRIIASNKLYAL